MTIAYANYSGTESGLEYGARSVIVGPDAQILAKAGAGQAILIADFSVVSDIDKSCSAPKNKIVGRLVNNGNTALTRIQCDKV